MRPRSVANREVCPTWRGLASTPPDSIGAKERYPPMLNRNRTLAGILSLAAALAVIAAVLSPVGSPRGASGSPEASPIASPQASPVSLEGSGVVAVADTVTIELTDGGFVPHIIQATSGHDLTITLINTGTRDH